VNADGTLVVGLGNAFAGDDGVGLAVVEELCRGALPKGARAEILGTDSLRLPEVWEGEREVWLVDAVARGLAPGTLHDIDHQTLRELPQRSESAHHLSLSENLRWITLGCPAIAGVRFRLWGIEPASFTPGEGLSVEVARSVPLAARRIRAALACRLQV